MHESHDQADFARESGHFKQGTPQHHFADFERGTMNSNRELQKLSSLPTAVASGPSAK